MALTRGSTGHSDDAGGLRKAQCCTLKAALAVEERPCYPLLVNVAQSHHTFGPNVTTVSDVLTE
jgi:hypothetical protein